MKGNTKPKDKVDFLWYKHCLDQLPVLQYMLGERNPPAEHLMELVIMQQYKRTNVVILDKILESKEP